MFGGKSCARDCVRACGLNVSDNASPSAELLKAALIPYLHKKTGTEWRLKNDNDLHFNIILSVGCYCDKVLHVSLPNESGCSVMRATKTFGRTCHPLLFLVNERGKSIYVLLQ